MGTLSEEARKKVSGPSWAPLRQVFLDLSDRLLGVDVFTFGSLTTIYVKYQINSDPGSPVYAVAWLKTSKQIVVGLALPDEFDSPPLGPAPARMKYKGLTKYFTILQGDRLHPDLDQWAVAAYQHVFSQQK